MLSVDWLSLKPFDFNLERVESWISKVVGEERLELDDLALVFCTDDELLKMNTEHLNHDYYTDIITFDYSENDVVSGDLFVSIDRVADNAKQFGVGFDDELYRVIVHGVLHLCGYADKSDEEIDVMRKKEDYYLNKLKGFT